MRKNVKCPICHREILTLSEYKKFKCPYCKTTLDKNIVEDFIETPKEPEEKTYGPRKHFSWELFKPDEMKIFVFISLSIYSLFVIAFVRYKVVFAIIFYPVLYWFSCRWASKKEDELDWKNIMKQYLMLISAFLIVFLVIPLFLDLG